MSTTTSRPTIPMTNTVRNNQYSELSSQSNRDFPEPTSLTTRSINAWQSNNQNWTIHSVVDGAPNNGLLRIPSDSSDIHSGSSALTASSKAEPWVDRSWNHLRNTPPKLELQNENISPPSSRKKFSSSKVQSMLEGQNTYQKPSRSTFAHGVRFSTSQQKNSGGLDPLVGPFKFTREDAVNLEKNEKAAHQYLNLDKFGAEFSRYLPIESTPSRDGSVMTSGTSDSELNPNSTLFGNGNPRPNISSNNTISNCIPSQPSSFTTLESSLARQTDALCFDLPSTTSSLGGGTENDTDDVSSPNPRLRRSHEKSLLGLQYFPGPINSSAWNEKSIPMNTKEFYSHRVPPDQSYIDKVHCSIERELISPGGDQNRRCSSRAIYPCVTPAVIDRYDFNNSRLPLGSNSLERRVQNGRLTYPSTYAYDTHLQSQITPYFYELPRTTLRSDNLSYACGYSMLTQPYQSSQLISAQSAKEQDVGVGFRSALLEEFRTNTKYNKKYELKDLYHHIVEFSGDQHGSRLIQTKLETANSDDKEQIFREIQPNALQLMTDVYGNYVIQKLFEHGNQVQKRALAQQLKNHVMELSLQMYGCRVIQKALEHVLDDQQAKLIEELQVDILKCVKDQNGNHVVQKAIERLPSPHIQFIIDAFRGKVEFLATHPYGCRVIQRILEFCKQHDQVNILKELHECAETLISDQYGNYVIQHVIQHGTSEDRDKIQNLVTRKLLKLSKHKFASNVVEKCIIFGTEEQRLLMVSLLTGPNIDGTCPLQLMMKDQFGNYVIQKLLAQLHGTEKAAFLSAMKIQLLQIKRFNCGKQIEVIEKLLINSSQNAQSTFSSAKTSPNNSASTISNFSSISNSGIKNDASMIKMRKSIVESISNSQVAIDNSP